MSTLSLPFKLTAAGLDASFNLGAINLNVTHVQTGSGNRLPNGNEVALVTPEETTVISGHFEVSAGQHRIAAVVAGSASVYTISEIGLWSGVPGGIGSVLVFYWSLATGYIAVKSAGIDFNFEDDISFGGVVPGNITIVADTQFNALAMLAAHEAAADPHPVYATTEEVLALIAGNAPDHIVRYTTTGNIALTGLGTQAGGDWSAALTAGDLILVSNQTTGSENGWYIAAAGAWTRATFADVSAEIKSGCLTQVREGVTLADTIWMLTTDGAITLGATSLVFSLKTPALVGVQGAIKDLNSYATGIDAHYHASIDEVVLADGAGGYITRRGVFFDVDMAAAAGINAINEGIVAVNSWHSIWAIYNKSANTDAAVAVLAPTLTGNTTSGSAVVTGLSSTARMHAGMPIRSANFPPGTVVKSVDSGTQVTMVRAALASTAGVNIEFVYDPVMPDGYTYKAFIDWIRTDGTVNKYPLSFTNHKGKWRYKVIAGTNVAALPMMASGMLGDSTTPTWVPVSATAFVPPTAVSIELMLFTTNQNKTSTCAPSSNYGGNTTFTNPPLMDSSTGTTHVGVSTMARFNLESTTVVYASSDTQSGLQCYGFGV